MNTMPKVGDSVKFSVYADETLAARIAIFGTVSSLLEKIWTGGPWISVEFYDSTGEQRVEAVIDVYTLKQTAEGWGLK
jgi:hypothetical protein